MIFAKDDFVNSLSNLGWAGALVLAVLIVVIAWVVVNIIRKF